MRVYELAKELGVTSALLLKELADTGEFVRSASSKLEGSTVRDLREKHARASAAPRLAVQRYRVSELAGELGVDSMTLLRELIDDGEDISDESSPLEGPAVRRLRALHARGSLTQELELEPDRLDANVAALLAPGVATTTPPPLHSIQAKSGEPAPAQRSAERAESHKLEGSVSPPRQMGWRAGSVLVPKSTELLRNIERLAKRFRPFSDHLAAVRMLGSQVVYAGSCRQRGFESCGVAHVRFSAAIENGFGFTREVMFFYSPHGDLHVRTFEAAVRELSQSTRRPTPDTLFFWSPDARLETKLHDWSRPSSLAIPLTIDPYDDLSLITLLRNHVYARDLFYVTTPVSGASFFGRRTLLQSLRDDVLSQRVTGIFGLRKSGKTSILQQLRHELSEDNVTAALIDLEAFPSPPDDPTDDLMQEVIRRLLLALKTEGIDTEELSRLPLQPTILDFKNTLQLQLERMAPEGRRILLMLDEIEYLTPVEKIDVAEGAMPRISQFLASLRSLVQECSNFTFLLSGLTSAIVESGRLYGRPNPLFSWARAVYVGPLTKAEADNLATTVGGKMGIRIDAGALEALHEASGGHAFLYRNLSSAVVAHLPTDVMQRFMDRRAVLSELEDWSSRIQGNIQEMVHHVTRYYPTEGVLLELLLSHPADFSSLAAEERVAIRRLTDLGLLHKSGESYEPNVVLELV